MKKLLLIILIIIASLNFLYTFGYQGEPMSQLEFLSRTLGSIIILVFSIVQLNKVTTKKAIDYSALTLNSAISKPRK